MVVPVVRVKLMPTRKPFRSKRQAAKALGFRSGLEESMSKLFQEFYSDTPDAVVEYEKEKITYVVPASNHKYTPDFKLPNGIYIETKGRFMPADMKKHLLIKQQHPLLDIRFIFQNPNGTNSKRTKTTYADFCEKHDFKYCSYRDTDTILAWARE